MRRIWEFLFTLSILNVGVCSLMAWGADPPQSDAWKRAAGVAVVGLIADFLVLGRLRERVNPFSGWGLALATVGVIFTLPMTAVVLWALWQIIEPGP